VRRIIEPLSISDQWSFVMSEVETPAVNDWKKEASTQAIQAVSQVEEITEKSTRSASETMTHTAEEQREVMNKAAEQFGNAGRGFAQGSAEKLHTLMTFAGMAQGGAQDLQGCLHGLVEGVMRTNLRLAQEIFLVESPRAFVELQQRFVRDYFDAFQQGVSALIRATERISATEVGHPPHKTA
jgi:hypothetical protein